MKMDISDERYQAWVGVNQLLGVISKGRALETRESGLSPAQFAVIMAIKNTPENLTSARIGRILLRKPQAMTGLIRRMEASGLITKKTQGNKGEIVISVTKKGLDVYEQAAYSDIIPDAFSSLDAAELAQFLNLSTKVRDQATKSLASKYATDIANLM